MVRGLQNEHGNKGTAAEVAAETRSGMTQMPSQLQRLVTSISGLDGRLSDATTLTDTKFTQLNEQMNVISEFIDEDREFRDQFGPTII